MDFTRFDWKGMAEKMVFLARNPGLRKEMSIARRFHVEVAGNFYSQFRKLACVLDITRKSKAL